MTGWLAEWLLWRGAASQKLSGSEPVSRYHARIAPVLPLRWWTNTHALTSVHMRICAHAHAHIHTCMRIYIRECAYTYVHAIHTCMHTCVLYIRACAYTCMCAFEQALSCMHVCIRAAVMHIMHACVHFVQCVHTCMCAVVISSIRVLLGSLLPDRFSL